MKKIRDLTPAKNIYLGVEVLLSIFVQRFQKGRQSTSGADKSGFYYEKMQ
jgi:hypothetical protein